MEVEYVRSEDEDWRSSGDEFRCCGCVECAEQGEAQYVIKVRINYGEPEWRAVRLHPWPDVWEEDDGG